MAWPDYESLLPAPLRGGPIPPDVDRRTWESLREAWRRQLARRVHGAEEVALALMVLPSLLAPYALIFDGRGLEVATPVPSGKPVAVALEELPRTGMVLRQGGVITWRESLTADQAQARWRSLGGDEAFALPPLQPAPRAMLDGVTAYALVRRGADRVRVELGNAADLSLPANAPLRSWARRFAPWLPTGFAAELLGAIG